MRKQLRISYHEIISLENLFAAWREFLPGKRKKKDVQEFGLRLADNILQLHTELANFSYVHGGYEAFNIFDPKLRSIHKASVRDRVLHHAIYRKLYPFFDKTFIADSFSCRLGKGTHKALNRFVDFGFRVSKNHTRTVWVLKGDVKKFFSSIGHGVLLEILSSYISDKDTIWLLKKVIESFSTHPSPTLPIKGREHGDCKGLPLGNLTSQLFCNIYMNGFDHFVKHKLKAKFYIRYADDFVILHENRKYLENILPRISLFLERRLQLSLHPGKVSIKTLASGADFLGWMHFPYNKVLRTITKRRMFKKLQVHSVNETLQSYLGLLNHGNAFGLRREVLNYWHLRG